MKYNKQTKEKAKKKQKSRWQELATSLPNSLYGFGYLSVNSPELTLTLVPNPNP